MHVPIVQTASRSHLRLGLAAVVATVSLSTGSFGAATTQAAAQEEGPAVVGPDVRLEEAGRLRLARLLTRTSLELLRLPEPAATDYRVALTLSEWATELAPDWLEGWRIFLQIASVAESVDDQGPERLRRALSAIVRIDPRDEVARLRLLSLAVDRYGTVEERAAAYERLLAPENLSKLGGPVASRLALELALLLYRNGDVDGFAARLAEAVALDPSNPSATEMAAGFLRHRVADPVGEAELALAAAVANPANLEPLQSLATICLSNGAFVASQRLYGIVLPLMPVQRQAIAEASAGLALSEWCSVRRRRRSRSSRSVSRISIRSRVRRLDCRIRTSILPRRTRSAFRPTGSSRRSRPRSCEASARPTPTRRWAKRCWRSASKRTSCLGRAARRRRLAASPNSRSRASACCCGLGPTSMAPSACTSS